MDFYFLTYYDKYNKIILSNRLCGVVFMEYEVLNKEEEERRIKEFKSLYYELNAKPDSTTKLYNDKVIVTKDDIERLDDLIREKMSFHSKSIY